METLIHTPDDNTFQTIHSSAIIRCIIEKKKHIRRDSIFWSMYIHGKGSQ